MSGSSSVDRPLGIPSGPIDLCFAERCRTWEPMPPATVIRRGLGK